MKFPNASNLYRLGRRPGQQGPRPSVADLAEVEKLATGPMIGCKSITKISTFNVRTLGPIDKIGELVALAAEKRIDIVCIQEHRIFHEEIDINFKDVGKGWRLVTTSCWKNSVNSRIGGVGILISPNAYKSLLSIEKISPRILMTRFKGNPEVSVVSCYSPTNCSPDSEAENFYNLLSDVCKQIPKHDIMVVCGDMNAQLGGEDIKGYVYGKKTNRNGQYLLNMAIECDLIISNTRFQKHKSRLWTFSYPNGKKAQLDYILVNKKWQNSVKDCQAYNSFNVLQSDHRIVSVKLKLSLRRNLKPHCDSPPDWQLYSSDKSIQDAYSVEVSNRFEVLSQDINSDSTTANDIYSTIVQAHKDASEKCIPKKKHKKKRVPWEDKRVSEKRGNLKQAHHVWQSTPTPATKEALEQAKIDLQNAYDEEQALYIAGKCREIEIALHQQQSRKVWNVVKELSGQSHASAGRLKGSSQEERLEAWRQHFSDLLGHTQSDNSNNVNKVVADILPIAVDDFDMVELHKAIKSLSVNKSPGIDEIPSEIWKSGVLDVPLLQVCNKMLHYGEKPDLWSKSIIIPIPKKGDLGRAENYRGIALTPVASKIYNKMILNRIRPYLEPILRDNQNGFRPGRSTIAQILTLRRMIEGIKAKNLPAVLTFIDFKKAFDSVNRKMMLSILAAYGIPDKIISAIALLYRETEAMVRTPDGDTGFFPIHSGVLQGDTLAPFLFIIVLDYVMRSTVTDFENLGFTLTQRKSRRYPAVKITDADFADDIALFSDNIKDAQELLDRLELAANEVGLYLNTSKTEFMMYNLTEGDIVTNAGTKLKCVEDFKYLGSWVHKSANDLNIRIALAWTALNKMTIVWKSSLSRQLKIRFFRATVESVLLYGSETWTLTKALKKRLDGTYTRLLRTALNVSWEDHITNRDLYQDLLPITEVIKERRLRFVGHCWRSKSELASKLILWDPSHGKRSRGRPAITFIDQLEEDTGIRRNELPKLMDDRLHWKNLIIEVRVRST